jgi:iron complex outermembrane receptor protein
MLRQEERISGLLVAVLVTLITCLPARAQQAPAAAGDQASEQTLQTVIVTGSVIKRTDFETPSPVQVMTAQDLQQSGYTSVSDVLRNLSANGAGTLSQSFGLAFAGGGSGVALRGLTVGGTLTLVDSERMIPYPLSDDGQRNFVDITQIPFNVIDHIDVLKDGASAEYGSDAIAGVVNVVLKKTFTGAQFTADAGTTSKSDGTTEHLAGIWGIGDLGSDGYNAYISAEFRHQDPILLSNRSGAWTNLNYLPYGGYDTRYGSPNSAPASSTLPAILGGYVLDPNATATTPANTFGASTVFLHPTASCQNYASFEAGGCIYNPPFQLQPQTGNLDILSRLTKNLGGDWQAVVTGSLFRSEAEQVGQNNAPYASLFSGVNTTTLNAVSAGVPPNPVTTAPILLPVGAPNNPFTSPAALMADFPQLGMSQTQFVTNTYRLFGDIRGSAAGWDIDGTLGWMYSELTATNSGFIIPGALAATAASGFNFTTATPGQLAQAFAPTDGEKDTNTMEVVDLHGTRELAQLPGGALSVALGAGMYHLYKNSPAPTTVGEGLQLGNNAFVLGGQTDTNAYLEFVAPIIKGLEIDAAGRFDRYNTYGSSVTPKFGVKYSPFKLLTLRGTYGKGFRAPNAAESGEAAQGFSGGSYNDTVLCPNPTNPNAAGNFPTQCNRGLVALGVSNPDLQPEKSTNWTAGIILTPLDNTSISFDYWDIKVNQDIQSGFNVLGLCESAPTSSACQNPNLFPIVRGPQVTLPFCTSTGNCTTQELTPVGTVLYQAFPYLNLTQTHVSGLDMDLASRFDIGSAGRLNASLNYSHTFHYIFGLAGDSVDLAGTHGPQIISGDTGNPKDRAVASLAWDLGPWNVTASVNYVGTYNLTDPTSGYPTCQAAIQNGGVLGPQLTRFSSFPAAAAPLLQYCDVKSFTDVDLYARYAFNKNWEVHGSIMNVFGTQPPVDLQTYGAAPGDAPYSPAMAQAGAVGRFFNVGATYTF